jgi:hypothetical protein
MAFVATGKCSAKVICNGEYKKFEGVIFTLPHLLLADWPETI